MEIVRVAFYSLKKELCEVKVSSFSTDDDNPLDLPNFNGHETKRGYENYLDSLMKSLFNEILENQVNIIPKSIYSHYLLELETEFEKMKGLIYNKNIQGEEKRIIFDHKYLSFVHEDTFISDYDDFINRISEFIAIQLGIIDSITRFISKKIEEIDSSSINTMKASLVWEKQQTYLLELIVALIESGSIQNANKNITFQEAFDFFSNVFGLPLKNAYKLLNSARNSKKDRSSFLSKLDIALEEYYIKKRNETD